MRTKKEIRLIIDELVELQKELKCESISQRLEELHNEMIIAPEDFMDHIITSHKILCKIKNMDLKEAYGHDPYLYYAAGVGGEAGEILNKIVKTYRNGHDEEGAIESIRTELPDVYIYGAILAYVAGIDLLHEVNLKTEIVVKRAIEGYYGGPIK